MEGARILDFTWLNAGAKGTRHLALYGADVVHIEWKGKLDVLRTSGPHHKMPGDDSPGTDPGYSQLSVASVNRGASFNNNHVGKWGISLNMRDPKGKEVFRELLRVSDAVVDNFTAATLADWGFPFDEMVKVKPDIVYVQAPGFGFQGPYRDYRSYGPTAAAISGLTFMSGLPDRYPVGYGFSYMDVCRPLLRRHGHDDGPPPARPHQEGASGLIPPRPAPPSSSPARRSWTGRRTTGPTSAPATARPTNPPRPTGPTAAAATTCGSPSPAATTPSGTASSPRWAARNGPRRLSSPR